MAINTVKATIQMRNGLDHAFDPDQMTVGEWAVSTDTRRVWMCFAPGIVKRMATYEAFEEDMKEIQMILATCRDIKTAVERFEQLALQHKNQAETYSISSKSWAVGGTGSRTGEDTDNAEYYSNKSSDSAALSKSWATGGTGTRVGEDTNNSRYYSEKSRENSESSKNYLTRVEKAGDDDVDKINNAVAISLPNFNIDLSTGHLLYESIRFDFMVNRNTGHLEWGLSV